MTRVVHVGYELQTEQLVIVSARLRIYAALSRDGTYAHLIRPARSTDLRVVEGRARVGDLMCDCIGSATHGRCYQQMNAEAFERADHEALGRPDWADPDPRDAIAAGVATFDAPDEPAGAGYGVEAGRG